MTAEWMACLAQGRYDDYLKDEWKTRPPKCNRKSGHEGPHRLYAHGALVKAEWEDR